MFIIPFLAIFSGPEKSENYGPLYLESYEIQYQQLLLAQKSIFIHEIQFVLSRNMKHEYML